MYKACVSESQTITVQDVEKNDQVFRIGKAYIPTVEQHLRSIIYDIFKDPAGDSSEEEFGDFDLLAEAVFWSLGELINNANKANNRWAILRNALFQRAKKENPQLDDSKLYQDIDYAIEHNQNDMLKKYNMENLDLTSSILRLIDMHKTNSFALSERFNKHIDLTLRIREKNGRRILIVNVINNSPITVVDKDRVEFNLGKIKDDLINSGQNPFEAAINLYDKTDDHAGGGFGAGLRSIVLFMKEGYRPFNLDIVYSRLIQYRSAGGSTVFSVELPIPTAT